jgi:hypothetical protein
MRISAGLPLAFLTLAAIVTAVAGCSGSGSSSVTSSATATPVPAPTAVCTPPGGVPLAQTVQMVFPVNGGTGQANLQGVVFAVAPSPLPTNWYFYVTSTYGSTYGTAQIGFLGTPAPGPSPTASTTATASPSPLPTPSTAPSFASNAFVYESATIGTFANNTQFYVYLANSNCTPPSASPSSPLYAGTFTTATVDTPTASPSPTST